MSGGQWRPNLVAVVWLRALIFQHWVASDRTPFPHTQDWLSRADICSPLSGLWRTASAWFCCFRLERINLHRQEQVGSSFRASSRGDSRLGEKVKIEFSSRYQPRVKI